MKRLIALAMFAMASCTPEASIPPTRAAGPAPAAGQMKAFAPAQPVAALRPNSEMALDFLDLAFQMESGASLPILTRFDGPILVGVTGAAPAHLRADLDALLGRLRAEAGIDVRLTQTGPVQISVEAVPQADLQKAVPRAACFVVPRIANWQEFLRNRTSARVDWTTLQRRDRVVIFVPSDAPPQEIRDCLHEELAQALGPLNDLYRLPDSVFNDDNIHAVLTGFDMLMLRLYYAPELANGMSRAQVAEQLPRLLSRYNPAGDARPGVYQAITSRDWIDAMDTALAGTATAEQRRAAAERAISIARTMGWRDVREGFSYYALGRLQISRSPDRAIQAFGAAEAIYGASPQTAIHAAHIAVQMAAFALANGDTVRVIGITDAAMPIARQHQNAALLATLMMLKAEALDMQGRSDAASALRLDSLGWARYGFGAENNVVARYEEIRALRPF